MARWTFRFYDDRGRVHWQGALVERRCSFRHETGGRCRERTALVHPFCERCLPAALRVTLRKSRVRGGGRGLFACDPRGRPRVVVFAEGDFIAPYLGQTISERSLKTRYFETFSDPAVEWVRVPYLVTRKSGYLDAALFRGPAAYCNDARSSRRRNNARLRADERGELCLYATATIRNGDEILLGYGPTFWRSSALRFETVRA